jgi:NADH:ubiquinone oxidoreductase subunit E
VITDTVEKYRVWGYRYHSRIRSIEASEKLRIDLPVLAIVFGEHHGENMHDTLTRDEIKNILGTHDHGRENLIPLLQDIQERLTYLSPEALAMVAEHLDLSENDVYGVATFYAQFRFHPPGKHRIKVCQGTACHVRGGGMILDAIVRKIGIAPGETSKDMNFSLERVACFGSCALPPVVVVDDKVYGRMTARKTEKLIEELE